MKLQTVHLLKVVICLTIFVSVTVPSLAQRSSHKGFGLDLLRSNDVLREIGVSDAVIDVMNELRRNTTTDLPP